MSELDRYVTLLGRILIAYIFVTAGISKLGAPAATMTMLAGHGLPVPVAAYIVTVIVELGFGLLLLFGFQTRLAGIVLAIWCVATALVAHTNFADRNMEIHFFKNIAMAGGLLFVFAHGAGAISIDAMLRRRRVAHA